MKNKAIAVSIILLITALTSSCEKAQAPNELSSSTLAITGTASIYGKSELPRQENFTSVKEICYNRNSDSIFIFNSSSDSNVNCIITDSTFEKYKPLNLDLSLESNDLIAFDINENGIYSVITHIEYDETNNFENYFNSYTLKTFDKNGQIISESEIGIIDDLFNESNTYKSIQNIKFIDENKLMIEIDGEAIFIDNSGKVLGKTEHGADKMISHIILTNANKLLCLVSNKTDSKICEIDSETYQLKNEFQLPISNVNMICGDEKYQAYIYDEMSVYGLTNENSLDKIFDFVGSGFSMPQKLVAVGNENFIALSTGNLFLISEKSAIEASKIQEISLGTVYAQHDYLTAISEFNSQSTKYRINVTDYFNDEDLSAEGVENAELHLEMDIISGKAPDILLCDSNQIKKLSCKGTFADLYDYIDNDEDLLRSGFLPNVLEALETDGKLYSISPTFGIDTIAAKSKFVDKGNWSFDDLQNAYNTLPDDMALFTQGNNKYGILYSITRGGANFIDFENMMCRFDSDDFINALEFAAEFPNIDENQSDLQYTYNDTALLSSFYIYDFREFNTKIKSEFGEDIAFVGYPTSTGQGSMLAFGQQLAITNDSDNKEGAWSFVKHFLLSDSLNGMSVISDIFDDQVLAATERPSFINSSGSKEYYDEMISLPDGTNLKIEPMTIHESKLFSDFVKSINVSSSSSINSSIYNIIEEESTLYFEGVNTAKQCAEMIQSRVSLMLDEQR